MPSLLVYLKDGDSDLPFSSSVEYKKAKQELKKATAETNKWQKKVKKGELGEQKLPLKPNAYILYAFWRGTIVLKESIIHSVT